MKSLGIKLKEIENKINLEKSKKIKRNKKIDQREKKIHLKYIKAWNSGVLNNKTFINNLNMICNKFKKIDSKNNYSWIFYAADISSREKVKDKVAFYFNYGHIDLQLSLSGLYSRVSLDGVQDYKIEQLKEAKQEYLNLILETFKSQNEYLNQ